jgi:hypothetical protein
LLRFTSIIFFSLRHFSFHFISLSYFSFHFISLSYFYFHFVFCFPIFSLCFASVFFISLHFAFVFFYSLQSKNKYRLFCPLFCFKSIFSLCFFRFTTFILFRFLLRFASFSFHFACDFYCLLQSETSDTNPAVSLRSIKNFASVSHTVVSLRTESERRPYSRLSYGCPPPLTYQYFEIHIRKCRSPGTENMN